MLCLLKSCNQLLLITPYVRLLRLLTSQRMPCCQTALVSLLSAQHRQDTNHQPDCPLCNLSISYASQKKQPTYNCHIAMQHFWRALYCGGRVHVACCLLTKHSRQFIALCWGHQRISECCCRHVCDLKQSCAMLVQYSTRPALLHTNTKHSRLIFAAPNW